MRANKELQALQIVWRLTVVLCVSEIGYGMFAGSLGLVSDGVHSFANCLGVGTSLLAARYANAGSKSSAAASAAAFSYGVADRAEVLAAFANSVILFLLAGFLMSEVLHGALSEHSHHSDHGDHVAVVAFAGMLVNLVGLRLLHPHLHRGLWDILANNNSTSAAAAAAHSRLLNLEAVALHLAFDVVTSACVLAGALFETWTHINTDSIMAVGIALLTVRSANPMFQRTLRILAQASAQQYDYKLRELAQSANGILEFHQVHFWTLAPGKEVGSFIVRIRSDAEHEDVILRKAQAVFAKTLWSLTVQIQREKNSVAATAATAAAPPSPSNQSFQLMEEEPGSGNHHHHREEHNQLKVRDAAHII